MTLSTATPQLHQAYRAATRTPIGQSAILCGAEYAGTVTRIRRISRFYWTVTMGTAPGAFQGVTYASETMATHVWLIEDGRWVVDYHQGCRTIEVSRTRTLEAALGVAVWNSGSHGHDAGLW